MLRRFFHTLCVVLLLIAQQGAIVHATWHAGGDARKAHANQGHVPEYGTDHQTPIGQGGLCAFDLAFGQVLGGVHGSCVLPDIAKLPSAISTYTFNPRLGSEAVPAHSRGPPQYL
jgi:hypothetical protein